MLPITHGVSGGLETPGTSGRERADRLRHPLGSPVHVPSAGRVGAHARNPKQLTELLELRGIPGASAEGRERQARRGSASRDPRQRPAILRRGGGLSPLRVAQDAPPPADRRGAQCAAASWTSRAVGGLIIRWSLQ
jgi:hypothetical protein